MDYRKPTNQDPSRCPTKRNGGMELMEIKINDFDSISITLNKGRKKAIQSSIHIYDESKSKKLGYIQIVHSTGKIKFYKR